ncbi:hypothetical protein C8034_v008287 [Colletotrichum sidae]|uniref:Uncharacterized protein n=1 Tax=Colletotrichum sidae TaxID=1347389 RepID=A0A4R8T2P6_9PEZI|nr:hypothetical protein C8034_v008287 [Colletotrichum sidae]
MGASWQEYKYPPLTPFQSFASHQQQHHQQPPVHSKYFRFRSGLSADAAIKMHFNLLFWIFLLFGAASVYADGVCTAKTQAFDGKYNDSFRKQARQICENQANGRVRNGNSINLRCEYNGDRPPGALRRSRTLTVTANNNKNRDTVRVTWDCRRK